MDMKKKLDDAYLPDKDARKKRLVVGLSGGLNSYVSAYLLKIQKYDLVAVTVLFGWENYQGEVSKVLSCHVDQPKLDHVKEFCHQLGIPHMLVKASDEFKELVVENWAANRLTGTKPNPCWNCHELRMNILYEKMIELDAQGVATGHLAKIFKQESHHSVYVHTSNDELNDQSSILSRLPHKILDHLMLPLSDLQQKEIAKLAENFGLDASHKSLKMHECFDNKILSPEYLAKNVPPKYLKHGELHDLEKDTFVEHEGIHHYEYGGSYGAQNQRQGESLLVGKYSFQDKKIVVARPDAFKKQKIFLTGCKVSEETSWSEPLKGVVKISETEFADCWVYPKNLSSAVIEMESPHFILEGDMVTILKKKGKNSKVFLTGKSRYIPEEKQIVEEGKPRAKADYSTDF